MTDTFNTLVGKLSSLTLRLGHYSATFRANKDQQHTRPRSSSTASESSYSAAAATTTSYQFPPSRPYHPKYLTRRRASTTGSAVTHPPETARTDSGLDAFPFSVLPAIKHSPPNDSVLHTSSNNGFAPDRVPPPLASDSAFFDTDLLLNTSAPNPLNHKHFSMTQFNSLFVPPPLSKILHVPPPRLGPPTVDNERHDLDSNTLSPPCSPIPPVPSRTPLSSTGSDVSSPCSAHLASPTQSLLNTPDACWDAQLPVYIHPIMNHLRILENKFMPKPYYMDTVQTCITRDMRDNLVDYLVGVRVDLGLARDSIFLAVNYIDRYLSRRPVTPVALDAICLAALLVSTKYEEVSPPNVTELTRLLEGQFTQDEILQTETKLLTVLEFKLNIATVDSFLPMAILVADADPITEIKIMHTAWMALADYECAVTYLPSYLAAACVLVVVQHNDAVYRALAHWLGCKRTDGVLAAAVTQVAAATTKSALNIHRCTQCDLQFAAANASEA